MENEDVSRLCAASSFQLVTLPFKYLGMTISTKKVGVDECALLVDKITARLLCWGTRALSYASRCQLINFVLITLNSYWANIFIIPKKILKDITSVCRNFLWDGKPISSGTPLVAWGTIYKPKSCGGLGVKDCYIWNLVTIGKYVWNIANKYDSMWLKWICHAYLKGKDWRSYWPPKTASWTWKQICEAKDRWKQGYSRDKWIASPEGYFMRSGYVWLVQKPNKVVWHKWV